MILGEIFEEIYGKRLPFVSACSFVLLSEIFSCFLIFMRLMRLSEIFSCFLIFMRLIRFLACMFRSSCAETFWVLCLLLCFFVLQYFPVSSDLSNLIFPLEMTSYDHQYSWAPMNLKREYTGLGTEKRIREFRSRQALCRSDEKDVIVGYCELDEPVCRDGTLPPQQRFTFVYVTIFERLGFRLPFNDFEKEILTLLNVAPAQLHPNSWAFVRAFRILCVSLGLDPTPGVFFYFFELKSISAKQVWASLSGVSGRGLFTLFQSSYKGFKGIFIKILAPSHNPTLLDGFPLYWTRFPTPQTARQMEDLNPVERKSCETLEGLEVIFDIRKILELECREVDLKLFIGIIF